MNYRIQRLKEDLTLAQQRNKKQKKANANLTSAYNKKCNENTNLKQALNEIRECAENNAIEVHTKEYGNLVVTNCDDILKIIDGVGGNK